MNAKLPHLRDITEQEKLDYNITILKFNSKYDTQIPTVPATWNIAWSEDFKQWIQVANKFLDTQIKIKSQRVLSNTLENDYSQLRLPSEVRYHWKLSALSTSTESPRQSLLASQWPQFFLSKRTKGLLRLVLPAVNSCKSKKQVNIMVVNQNYHLLANHNSVAFTANLQLMFIILQPT